ncbi:MAG TPA: hypothetical protein VKA67_01960 [Verrucomicrobiae bacterium]|nr:hypothetical protein [Verrucomicrobiae bacterium]
MLVGHGIRAVRLRNFDPKRDKFGVEKGRIKTHRRGSRRTWHYEHIPFLGEVETIRLIADKVLDILSRHKGKEVDFQIWTGAGRISIGAGALFGDESEDEAIGILTGFVSQYAGISPQFEEWFLGIAWSVEKRGA